MASHEPFASRVSHYRAMAPNARHVEWADEEGTMKSAPLLTLIGCLVSTARPVSAQEKTEAPVSFDSRSPSSQATADLRARTAPSGEPSLCYGKADGAERIWCSDVQNATLFWVAG